MAVLAVLFGLVAMTVFAVINLRAALLLSVFILPWTGLDVDIGLRVLPYQVIMAPILLITIVRLTQPGFKPPPIAAGALLGIFLLYAIVWSLLQLGFVPQVKVGDSALRGPSIRAVIQIMLFIFAISPVVLTPIIITDRDDILRMGRLYVASTVVLGIIGWIQFVLWYTIGYNPIGIEAFNAALGGNNSNQLTSSFGFEALNIFRMNSFAGEPRELASGVSVALLMLQAFALTTPRLATGRIALLWAFLFMTLLATFSTSGLGLWLIASATLIPACWLFGVRIERSGRQLFVAAATIIVPMILVITAIQLSGFDILALLAERTIERLGSDGAIEDFDLAIIAYLTAVPSSAVTGVGLGNAHIYATPYLDPLFALYAEGNVFVAKTLYVRFISEVGIIGFVLFLAWYGWLAIQTRLALPARTALSAIIPIAGAVLVVNLGNVLVTPILIAIAGAMTTVCAVGQRQPRAVDPTGPALLAA